MDRDIVEVVGTFSRMMPLRRRKRTEAHGCRRLLRAPFGKSIARHEQSCGDGIVMVLEGERQDKEYDYRSDHRRKKHFFDIDISEKLGISEIHYFKASSSTLHIKSALATTACFTTWIRAKLPQQDWTQLNAFVRTHQSLPQSVNVRVEW